MLSLSKNRGGGCVPAIVGGGRRSCKGIITESQRIYTSSDRTSAALCAGVVGKIMLLQDRECRYQIQLEVNRETQKTTRSSHPYVGAPRRRVQLLWVSYLPARPTRLLVCV